MERVPVTDRETSESDHCAASGSGVLRRRQQRSGLLRKTGRATVVRRPPGADRLPEAGGERRIGGGPGDRPRDVDRMKDRETCGGPGASDRPRDVRVEPLCRLRVRRPPGRHSGPGPSETGGYPGQTKVKPSGPRRGVHCGHTVVGFNLRFITVDWRGSLILVRHSVLTPTLNPTPFTSYP